MLVEFIHIQLTLIGNVGNGNVENGNVGTLMCEKIMWETVTWETVMWKMASGVMEYCETGNFGNSIYWETANVGIENLGKKV